jgi:4-amino-4-deoxy-L-arabinose transferase-like glycosyltransferase
MLLLWILSGIVLLIGLGNPPVSRTQEARVLETARQMIGTGYENWLIPKLNGRVRLQKPPLPYWMSAASYKLFGVGEFSGRLPFALVAWLTLGITFLGARWVFDSRTAFLATMALLGSYLFARHMRLAETDGPAALFVTLATLAFWRATSPPHYRDGIWFHIASIGVALALLSKGASAIFPVLFFVALVVAEKRWDALWRFVRCGAPITFAVIALPWFAYVGQHEGFATFRRELWNNYTGGDHNRPLVQYIPALLLATAPWTALFPVAVFESARRFRTDARCRALILWLLAIALPLCVAGNRQNHYLLPLMPPIMILVGWLVGSVLDRAIAWVIATVIVFSAAPVAILIAAAMIIRIQWLDVVASGAIGVALLGVVIIWKRRGRVAGSIASFVAAALFVPLLVTLILPRLRPDDTRALARQIERDVGRGPFRFYGPASESITLCFNLRQSIPMVATPEDAIEAARSPDVTLISIDKDQHASPPPPAPWSLFHTMKRQDQVLKFYRVSG